MADRDTAAGFGATAETSDNNAQINDLLDQARDLMVEDGVDFATAEALTGFARRGTPDVVGNLADLQRMGAIVLEGKVPATAGQPEEESSDINDAFKRPPAQATAPAGLQTPLGTTEGAGGTAAGTGGGLEDMTKTELIDEAESRGVDVSSSMTKAEIIAAIEAG